MSVFCVNVHAIRKFRLGVPIPLFNLEAVLRDGLFLFYRLGFLSSASLGFVRINTKKVHSDQFKEFCLFVCFLFLIFGFRDRVSLYGPGCPETL